MSWKGKDRRKFARVNYPCMVVINDSKKKLKSFLTHTENIGIGGVGLILKNKMEMYSVVKLELDLLDCGENIKCEAKVVWVVRRKMEEGTKPLFYDIGLEFVDISSKDQKRLSFIVDKIDKRKSV